MQSVFWAQASSLREAATSDPLDAELPMKIEMMENNITKENYDLAK